MHITIFMKGCPSFRHLNWGEHEFAAVLRIGETCGVRQAGKIHYGTIVELEHEVSSIHATNRADATIGVTVEWRVSYDDI